MNTCIEIIALFGIIIDVYVYGYHTPMVTLRPTAFAKYSFLVCSGSDSLGAETTAMERSGSL